VLALRGIAPPEKSPLTVNLPVKIRLARLDPIMGRHFFYVAGDILIRGRHIKSVISLRADFSWGRHFNVTPLAGCRVLDFAPESGTGRQSDRPR